jgi:xanthine dehydrogenase accessory factor
MDTRGQFKQILKALEEGRQASLTVTADEGEYKRNFLPRERLILLGGGNIAQPLCAFAAQLGFSVVVVDDRAKFVTGARFPEAAELICDAFPEAIRNLKIRTGDYVCVITRGHQYDADCLRTILPGIMPKYLGMIGSKRRTIALLNLLETEGFQRERLDQIHTPIGLDIGALTVKEIAVSILAQLIAERRKDLDRRSRSHLLTNEDIDENLIRFIAEDKTPKAMLLVLETSGSTPVKSGSYMAVTDYMKQLGTIGGGCGESAVLHDAVSLIGTGERKVVTVNMSNDVASEEGMVCGGSMKVLIEDIPVG